MNQLSEILQLEQVQATLAQNERSWPQVVDQAIAIQQVPAPTFAELERARVMQRSFSDLSLADVERDDIGNVYARIPGSESGSPVVVSAHLDTVFAAGTDLAVRRENGRVYGPGICDNSLGLAGLLALARQLSPPSHKLDHDVWLVANVGEEGLGDLRGMRKVADRFGPRATYLVVEGGVFGHVYYGGIGVRRFELVIQAPGGHSWGNFGSQSAIHVMGRIINHVSRMSVTREPKSTFNVGIVEGGTSVNTIAEQARMLIDLRSEDAASLEGLVAKFKTIVRDQTRHPNVHAVLTKVGDRPSGWIDRESPLVTLAVDVLAEVGWPQVQYEVGSTDANIPLSRGWNCVCVGLTKSANAHRLDEYMETEHLKQGLAQLYLLALAAAGVHA